MADHRAETTTQAQYPWRAVIRTIVQVGIPAFLAFALLLPEIVQAFLDQFGEQLPEGFRLWLLGVAALVTGVAAVITRIMALPRAIDFARRYLPWLAPDKQ
ncbi:hypothetical protein [Pseudarthrobacter polychromogenes]|uniref:Holin n=1 Tax=Pseudarthrobacter polychromogenes TaxID=1676 RepID=A0ABQ1X987_9MICC|nr:hypothetical protein [Pseudarthrobacter polychromogenes]GGG83518.1 hypothetical protein GCM10011577_01180 [Pseudarthrobacter polychromogenes]